MTESAVEVEISFRATAVQIGTQAAATQRQVDAASDAVFGVGELTDEAIGTNLFERSGLATRVELDAQTAFIE